MKNLFSKIKMNRLTVIVFAVLTGIYTGVVMCLPVLENTSLQDIGISYECWVIFAVIIVAHCEKLTEAALKCFVFFLISQPLIYLTEILFGHITLSQGWYYYRAIWLPMTFLTLPGGAIAWYAKKQNPVGAVIMGLGNTIQAILGVYYINQTIMSFPHHLLSVLVCFISIIIMTLSLQKKKGNRIIAFLLPVFLFGVLLIVLKMTGRVLY